jgi:chromosome segregation ATPase
MDGIRIEQEADRKHIEKLEEENKNLNEKLEQAIYWKVDYEKSYKQADAKKDELLEENKNLKDEIEHLEFDIEAWKKLKAVWEKKEQKLQIEI